MKKSIFFGLVAAIFFSSTFAINHWLNVVQSGSWYWTAALRYIYVTLLLSVLITITSGTKALLDTLICFKRFFFFWSFAGGIGFGLFYLLLCYAASFSPGWVLATTWQTTILFTPLVIFLLGKRVQLKGILYLLIIFAGILFVNSGEFDFSSPLLLSSALPILIAAFCYPLGNTLCTYACKGVFPRIPISQFSISSNVFSQVLMMTLGSMPVFIVAWIVLNPPLPNYSQLWLVFIVAILTGVIATSCLYYARDLAGKNTLQTTAVDSTQAAEPALALACEYLLFNGKLPNQYGAIGLSMLIVGLFLFTFTNRKID